MAITPDAGSLDPKAGGTYRDKPIWDLSQVEQNLNRTGYDWTHNNYGVYDDGVLNFGFWKNIQELQNSYYVNETGTISFNEAYYADNFSTFNADQMMMARKTIGLWADLTELQFKETKSGDADITYANTYTGGAQAYAYLPFGDTSDQYYKDNYDFAQAGRLSGDVWIDGFVSSNFFPVTNSYYATTTMIHETGHALGLSHPGDYNALDPDGNPVPVTYVDQAEYAQDSLQYSIMSYFDGYETGAQFIDFQLLNFAYPSTPMIHDIATIQSMYGANYETRAGDTVYGFNSTEVGTAYDFTSNTRPVLSIWDGAGNDTIDGSGFKTDSLIDLNAGAFSSMGGASKFYSLAQINRARAELGFAARTEATYQYYQDLIKELGVKNPGFKDNISIAYGVTIENAIGGKGDDKLIANNVANILNGGKGNDTVSYETATTGVQVTTGNTLAPDMRFDGGVNGAAGDRLISVENLIGSKFADRLSGGANANVLNGGAGDDVLIGRGGSDTFVFRQDTPLHSGKDTILDFSNEDFIATSVALPTDGAGKIAVVDGVLTLSTNGDSVTFANGGPASLHFVGKIGASYYYAADGNSANQATLDKMHGPANMLDQDAAVTQAMADAANKANIQTDLANRAEGWTGSSDFGATNGMFGEAGAGAGSGGSHVSAAAGMIGTIGGFAGEVGVHSPALAHLDYVTVHLA